MAENYTINFNVMQPLINFIKEYDYETDKGVFIEEAIENITPILNMDKEKGEIQYICSFYDQKDSKSITEKRTYSYEDFFRLKQSGLLESLIEEILSNKRLIIDDKDTLQKFSQKIEKDIEFILETYHYKVINYSVLENFINDFVQNLNYFGIFKKALPFSINPSYIPPFQLKTNWCEKSNIDKKFKKFHSLLNRKGIIEAESISAVEFYNVLRGDKTSKTIQFVCETPIAVKVLDSIKHIYNDLTPKSIEQSKRFKTKCSEKGNKSITAFLTRSNYYTALNRYNNKYSESNKELIEDIAKIFPK